MRSGAVRGRDDRTTRARIRDAAIACFAKEGVAATSIRAIAAAAEVSPGLVIHHFGSKDDLRHECDEHIAALIRTRKREAMAEGAGLDPVAALRKAHHHLPLTRYLARTLIDGSPQVATLVDELVEDAVDYMKQGVVTGTLRPTAFPYERAAVLTMWSLGALVLHEHLERLLGVDVTRDPEELAETKAGAAYFGAALEMLSDGVVSKRVAQAARAALVEHPDDATAGGEEAGLWPTTSSSALRD